MNPPGQPSAEQRGQLRTAGLVLREERHLLGALRHFQPQVLETLGHSNKCQDSNNSLIHRSLMEERGVSTWLNLVFTLKNLRENQEITSCIC